MATPQLNSNEIFTSIANMIISQEVFADNIGKHQTLVDKARVDGGLYGDQKVYYSTDVLQTHVWGTNLQTESTNLLDLERPGDPEVQSIKLDVFRQIRVTIDNYLTKRAWSDEGAFSSFNGVILGWLRETKKIYDGTTYNVFIGTNKASGAKQAREITISATKPGESIAQGIADLLVEMSDYSRDFNDYGYLRSYDPNDVKVVWNSKFVNEIKKVDLPNIFHKDGLVDKLDEDVMPARYFGTVVTSSNIGDVSAATATTGKPLQGSTFPYAYTPGNNNANGTVRTKVECDLVGSASTLSRHYFPGDELPVGAEVVGTATTNKAKIDDIYIDESDKTICKVMTKMPPYMSAFEVGTSFFNPRSLTETHFLTFGHNKPEHLKNYPFITVKKK